MAKHKISIMKRILLSLAVGLLTVIIDFLFHLLTDPPEIINYYLIGFVGATLISFILFPLYSRSKLFVLLGGILWSSWKLIIYFVTKEPYGFIPIRYSSVDSLYDITVLGMTNAVFLFFWWAFVHSGAYILALLAVYYLAKLMKILK